MGDVGPEKFVVTAQSLYDFMKINFMEFVLDFLGGEHDEIEVERADNAGLFGGEDTSVDIADLDFGKVLQSLTFGQGTLGLMLSEALLNTLIKLIDANWEFDDMGNIRFDADLMQNVIEITVPLDAAVRDADGNILSDSKLNYAVRLSNINVHIGEAVDFIASTGKTDFSAFDEYKDISSYVWITEVNSSLGLYNDDENTIVDLTDLTMRFISGLGIKLRNGEALLDVSLDFVLRTYIDFSDLGNLGFELLINRRGRTLIGLTFIGAENDGSLYINLEGLGFNKFYITGVDIGSMLTEVLKSLEQDVSFGDEETAANSDGSISGSISSGDKGAIDYGDISDAGISTNLLLALFDENKFNVAMTGALLLNLLGTLEGIRDISAMIPMFANIQIGYEKDKLSGIKFVYDEGQHFSIDYSFEKSYTYLVPKRDLNDIANTAYDDARMHMVKSTDKTDFVNIDNLKNVNIGLTLDLTLTTVNADGSKSEPVEQFEALLESLLGMKEGSVDLQFQDMYAAITLSVEIIADLTNINNSKLKVEIIYNDETLIGIYYLEGAVYLDLGELGLMKAAINGVDLMGALTYFIGGELPIDLDEEKGLDIQGLITGLLNTGIEESEKGTTEKTNTSIEEQAVEDAIEALKENYLTRYENGEFDDLTATEQEEIKAEIESALMTINTDNGNVLTESEFDSVYKEIVRSIGFRVQGSIIQEVTDSQNTAIISLLLYDDRIEITPAADALSALLGMDIPEFQGMLISMNLDAGFTNLMLNVNMDGDNRMTVSMPEEGGIRLGFNLTDAEIVSKMGDINTNGFGGINGLFVGANGISVDIEKLGDGLLDTLDIDNLEINIEKRGDYWTRRDLYSLYPYVNDSGPTYYADDFAGYDGDDAELFTAIIKIIKIAKMVYDIIDAIKTLAETIGSIVGSGGIAALWSVGNIIKLVMKVYDIIKGVNDLIDEVSDIDDQHYPELSRNNYSRGRVLVNRMTNNVLELELGVPSVKNGAIVAYIEDSTILVSSTLDISISLLGINFDVDNLIDNALTGMSGDYEMSGVPLDMFLYPLNINSIMELINGENDFEDTSGYYGRLYGRLTDQTGAPVKNATVTYTTDSEEYTVQSDKDGYYYFVELPMTKHINPKESSYTLQQIQVKILFNRYNNDPSVIIPKFMPVLIMFPQSEWGEYMEKHWSLAVPYVGEIEDGDTGIYEGVEYIYHNGYYYVNSDRGTLSYYADGYSSPASETNLYIEPAQTKKAQRFDKTMYRTSGESYATLNVKGYTSLGTTKGGVAASSNAADYINNLTIDDKVGGVTVKYNGGLESGTTNMIKSDTANYGSFNMTFNEYADLREINPADIQHKFELTLGGYEWSGAAVARTVTYDGDIPSSYGNAVYLPTQALLDEWIKGICTDISGTINVEIYYLLNRKDSPTVTIIGSLCEYIVADDYLVGNPVIGEYYEYDETTYAYSLTADEKFQANKTYYYKSIPKPDDFTIWIAVADGGGSNWQTLGVHDFYEVEPDNFSGYVDNENGTFSITSGALTKGKDFKLKIRSTKYQNIDLRISGTQKYITYTDNKSRGNVTTFEYTDDSKNYLNAVFVMERREAHWSDTYTDEDAPFLEGLRIRIGADVTEDNYIDGHPFVSSSTEYTYGELEYESGEEIIYNDYTYIEAWINSAKFNEILMMVNNLLWGMDGTMEVNPGAAITAKDISIANRTQEGDFDSSQYKEIDLTNNGEQYYIDRFINLYRGQYNENDFSVGDKIYQSEGAYKQAIISANQKTASGLIHYILMMLFIDIAGLGKYSMDFSFVGKILGIADEYYIGVIDLIAFAIASPASLELIPWVGGLLSSVGTFIGDVLGTLSKILTGLVPFYTGYNMFEVADLDQSPLNEAQYSYNMSDDTGKSIDVRNGSIYDLFLGGNSEKEYGGTYIVDDKEVVLKQQTVEHDRSVYAKITFNDSNVNGSLDNVRLVVNSASYDKDAESGGAEIDSSNQGALSDTSKEWNYNYNAYTGQNGRFFTRSDVQVTGESYDRFSEAGTVNYGGITNYNGRTLYVRVKDTDTYILASEMEENISQYETYYYVLNTSTSSNNVSKTYYFNDDTGAIYSVKATDIRTMMIIEKGKDVSFNGTYASADGTTVTGYQGLTFTTNAEFMNDWIGSSNYSSYSVTDVYYEDSITGEKTVYYRFFVYDAYGDKYSMANGNSIKDDVYQEIDIELNGIDLRNVITSDFSDVKFYRFVKSDDEYYADGDPDGTKLNAWTNPTKIILYDVYDITDFRAIGGTWAQRDTSGSGAGRRNYDATTTLEDILANRANVMFGDGTSSGSNGVGITWNFEALKSYKQVEGEKLYLQGYVGNAVFAEIEVEIETTDLNDADGAESDANRVSTELLQKAQNLTFDPYRETVEEFINKFYDVFFAEYSSTDVDTSSKPLREKTYIYNDLVWTLNYTLSDKRDADGNRIKVYDSLIDYDNATITLKFRTYGTYEDGTAYASNTAWSTITLNLKEVKNYTIDTAESHIDGEGVVDGGIIAADRELIKQRLKEIYPSLKDDELTRRANEYAGMVDINPLNNSDPYSTLEAVTSFDITLLTLKADGSKEVVSGWEIIPGSFTAEQGRDRRSLADYDSLDTSEQNYTVSYLVTDSTGNIQTVKVWVHIQASGIVGTSTGLENESNMVVVPYEETGLSSSASEIEQVISKLNLGMTTGIIYESTSADDNNTGETVSVGANAVMRYIPLVVPATDVSGMTEEEAANAYEVKGYIYIQGENGLSYAIPVKAYNDESKVSCTYKTSTGEIKVGEASFVIDLEVGKQGYARTEMNEILTNILLESAKSNTSYTLNKAKSAAYDVLYAESDRYTRNLLTESYNANKEKYPLLGDAGIKANVWDEYYNTYADETLKTYSPADALRLDVILLTEQLKYTSITYTGAKSRGYDSISASGIISSRKLAEILEEKSAENASLSTAEKKALAWDEWYEEYTRAVIGLARDIDTRTIGKVASVIFSATSASDISSMPEQASIYFEGLINEDGTALYENKKVNWLNEEELIEELRSHVGINGYITYAEVVLPDTVFGNQVARGIAVQLSIINAEGLNFNTVGNILGPNTGYYDNNGNVVYLGVDPYDESTIDDTLGYYFSQIPKNEGDIPNATISLIVSTEQGGTSIIDFSNFAWEFATYFDADGNEKIVWRYKNDTNNNGDRTDDGIGFDGTSNTEIEVLVQSYGYSDSAAGTTWQTWVTLNLASVRNSLNGADTNKPYNFVSDATITGIGTKATIDGKSVAIDKAIGKEYAYTMKIDPTNISLEDGGEFSVIYESGRMYCETCGKLVSSAQVNNGQCTVCKGTVSYPTLHGTIDLTVAEMQNFYNRSYVDTTITFGDKYNNRQTLTIRIYNATVRRFTEILDVEYYRGSVDEANIVDFDSGKEIASAYDDLNAILPDIAVVTAIVEDSTLEKVTLEVRWSNIDAYDNRGLTVGKDEKPKAYALIGNSTFGYTQDTVTLNIAAETIKSVDIKNGGKEGNLPDAINVDPYDENADIEYIKNKYVKVWMVSEAAYSTGTVVKERYVTISIDDSNIDYEAYRKSGYEEVTHTIYFNVGNTVRYGADNSYSFEVRAPYPVKATLLSRKIVAVIFRDRTVDSFGNEIIGDITELTGDIYKAVYLDSFDAPDSPYATFVQYGSGNEAIRITGITVDENSASAIEYTPGGGEFFINAYVGEGDLRQEFTITVRINKAMLLDIVNTENNKISAEGFYDGNEMLVYEYDSDNNMYRLNNLVIEPFIGFVGKGEYVANDKVIYNGKTDYTNYGLPQEIQVLLQKNEGTEVATLKVEWDYSAVLSVMSINGGEYDEELTNTIVLAKVYKDVDEKGNPVNVQMARVSVSVTPRTIQHYEVSYDVNGTAGTYAAIDDLVYTTYNGASTSTYELLLNPYNLKNAMFDSTNRINTSSTTYSEQLTDADGNYNASFSYFRYVKAICEGGYEIVYKLTANNYKIFDKATGYATVTNNLYTGRDINVTLTVGEDYSDSGNELLGAKDSYGLVVAPKTYGKDYVAADASEDVFLDSIDVRILDMTYEAGNGLNKDMYFIDVYGIIETFDKTLVYDKTVRSRTIIGRDNANYSWGDGYTGTITNIVSHTFDTLTYDGTDATVNRYSITSVKGNGSGGVTVTLKNASGSGAGKQINYGGGVGRLIVTFGSAAEQAAGGVQTFDIPVVYVERTVEDILFTTASVNGTTAPFYNSATKMFEFDPYGKYNNSPNGFAQNDVDGYEQGYIKDGQYAATLKFKATDIDSALNMTLRTANYDLGNQTTAQYVGVTFNDSNVTIKAGGGTFDVYAIIANSGTDNGLSRQRFTYKVKMMSRIAGVNDSVPHGTTDDGRVIYYHGTQIGGKYYQVVNGFTANLFKDEMLHEITVNVDSGAVTVQCLNEEKLLQALKVYEFIGQTNAGRIISDTIFKTTSQKFYVYGTGTKNPLEFTYTNLASNQVGEFEINGNPVKVSYTLTSDEISGIVDEEEYNNGIQMIFNMDASYSINYTGDDVRFYLTLPGYAAGRNEQQQLIVKVSTKEQYIPFSIPTMKYGFNGKAESAHSYIITIPANPSLGGATVDAYGYAWLTYFESVIAAKGGSAVFSVSGDKIYLRDETWGSNTTFGSSSGYNVIYMISYNKVTGKLTIECPYYFIEDSGIQMPDYITVYAGSKALKDEYNAAIEYFESGIANGYDFTAYSTFSTWFTAWMADADKGGSLDKYSSYVRKGETKYLTSLWSGGNSNKIVVNYNDTERASTFRMTIDDQSVRLTFEVVPWLVGGSEAEVILFRSTTGYGPEDIIMLPLETVTEYDGTKNADVIVRNFYSGLSYDSYIVYDSESGWQPIFDEYYGYRVYYTVGENKYYVNVTDIYGGGTSRNNYNKWYFGNVQFGVGREQYATMTLGGKGGQTIQWAFENLTLRTEVNNNVPSMVAISKTTPYALPKNLVVRYGSGDNDRTPANIFIPITYSAPVPASTSSTVRTEGNKVYYEDGNGYIQMGSDSQLAPIGTPVLTTSIMREGDDKEGYRLTTTTDVSSTSAAQSRVYRLDNQKDSENGTTYTAYAVNDDQIAKITWSVSGRCAYPATLDEIGGEIIVATYGSKAPFYFEQSKYVTYGDWKEYIVTYYNQKEDKTVQNFVGGDGSNSFKLYRPDNMLSNEEQTYSYSNAGTGSLPSGYSYNKTADSFWNLTNVDGVFKNWYTNSDGREIGSKVTLNIAKGTRFDIKYLPILSVFYDWKVEGDRLQPFPYDSWLDLPNSIFGSIWDAIFGTNKTVSGREGTTIMLPWQNAEVCDIDGKTVEGGFSMIDTSSTSNKYVLKLSFSLGDNSFELTVHVNVVVA